MVLMTVSLKEKRERETGHFKYLPYLSTTDYKNKQRLNGVLCFNRQK